MNSECASSRRGFVGRSAIALMALGLGSTLMGALVVGPLIGKQLGVTSPAVPPLAAGGIVQADSPSEERRRLASTDRTALPASEESFSERAAREGWDEPDAPEPSPAGNGPATAPPTDATGVAASSLPDTAPVSAAGGRTVTGTVPGAHTPEVSGSTAQKPPVETPVSPKPAIEKPAVEKPAVEKPAADNPAAPNHVVARPFVAKPVTAKPVTVKPGAETPANGGTPARPEAGTRLTTGSRTTEPASSLYRVRIGQYATREEAGRARAELSAKSGASLTVVPVDGGYRLQLGAYRRRENAEKAAGELRGKSLNPEISDPDTGKLP